MLFQHVGKRPDSVAELSNMLENVPTTSPRFPTCWKMSRRRRQGFQHVGKCPDGVAKVSNM